MNILELFAGSRSVGKVANKLGLNVFSVDWEKYENINLSVDIGELKKEDVPFIPDVVWASPDCFTAGTLIKTKNGYKEIQDIKIGDEVLTHKNRYRTVYNAWSKEADNILELKISGSENIYVTEEHPFLARKKNKVWNNSKRSYDTVLGEKEWVKAKDLDKNYRVQILKNAESKKVDWQGIEKSHKNQNGYEYKYQENILNKLLENEDFWWLMGRYLGDGWYRYDENKGRYDIGICCNKKEKQEIKKVLDRISSINYSIAEKQTTSVFTISGKEISKFASLFGKGSYGKFVPEFVLDLKVKLLNGFLNGYISSDGCKSVMNNGNVNVSITTISKKLAYGISKVILKCKNKFSCIVKSKDRKEIMGRKVNCKDPYKVSYYEEKKYNVYTEEKDCIWVNVKSNKKTKKIETVYNFSVEQDETYTANNITVHNCTTYTIAAISTHRNKTEPKSDYAKKCDTVNQHFISLIKEWLVINPNMVFFIENPRGMLRHMEWMQEFKRHTVWYCKYGDDRAKPTDIWTNSKTWTPRPECHNYKYDKQGNVIDKHCHHESARRSAKTGTQGKNGHYERSRIPEQLCFEVLKSCICGKKASMERQNSNGLINKL